MRTMGQTEDTIINFLKEKPYSTIKQMITETGMNYEKIRGALRRLEERGIAKKKGDKLETKNWYLDEKKLEEEIRKKEEIYGKLLKIISEKGSTVRDLATQTNLSYNTVAYILNRLREKGLVARIKKASSQENLWYNAESKKKLEEIVNHTEYILQKLQKGPVFTPQLASELGKDEETIVKFFQEIKDKGYDVVYNREEKKASLYIGAREKAEEEIPIYKYYYKILLLSDLFLGHKYDQITLLKTIYAFAEKEKVDAAFVVGNLVAGQPRKGFEEDYYKDKIESQIEHVVKQFPYAKSIRLNTRIISGPREIGWKKSRKGFDITRAICSKREDLIYSGDLEARFNFKGVPIYLIATGESTPYAVSYLLQGVGERIRGYFAPFIRMPEKQEMPRIVIVGGHGVFDYIPNYLGRPGIDLISLPSLRQMTPSELRIKKRGKAPLLGAVILELHYDKNWKLKSDGGIIVRPLDVTPWQVREDWRHKYSEKDYQGLSELEANILKFLDDSARTSGEIERKFNISEEIVLSNILELSKKGVQIEKDEATKKFSLPQIMKKEFTSLNLEDIFTKDEVTIEWISDTHLYSIDQQPTLLKEAYEIAEKYKVDAIIHCGDFGEGYSHYEGAKTRLIKRQLSDEMIEYFANIYPKSNIPTFLIAGGHDMDTFKKFGHDQLLYFSKMRQDINYLGKLGKPAYPSATVKIKDLSAVAFHPTGGASYARSYKAQGNFSALLSRIISTAEKELSKIKAEEQPVHVVGMGHHHITNYLIMPGLSIVSIPSFQYRTEYMESRTQEPEIGLWIVTYKFDKYKNVTEHIIRYFDRRSQAKEEDY